MNVTCEACGAPNRDTASFCNNCGRPLPVKAATGRLAAHALLNGRYEIAEVTGRGNMGAVYRAYDFQSDRTVAIKEMSDTALGAGQRSRAVDQFRREALLLQTLNHPNLVRVTDVFTEERRHYLVMDFVDGQSVSSLARRGRIPEAQVRAWALQLCDALAYLHSRQPSIVFRDLKPENIMAVEDTGQIKLIDFGIARFFDPAKDRDTIAIGTRGFMAPEALQGQTDPRSDLYSLGVTLHTLLTGFDPAADPWHLPPANTLAADVSEELAQIVAHAVQLDPESRFQTAAEFARALGGEVSAVEEVTAPAAPVAARVTSARPVRFNGREQVTGLEQLTRLCQAHWEAAVNHLRAGELEVWLELMGEKELARYARELRQQAGADMNVQLQAWLESTGKTAPPSLTASPPVLNLGAVGVAAPCIARLRIHNTGPGWLVGRVDPDAAWLAPEQPSFSGNNQVLRIRVFTDRLPQGAAATGSLQIRSNGGETQVPVRLMPVPGITAGAQASPPRWAAGVLSVLAVAGGAWLASQLADRWGLTNGFDIRTWLAEPIGIGLLPLAALCLLLAAIIGSIAQWEVLVSDAPLARWGRSALGVAGVTLAMLLLAAAAVSFGFQPLLLHFKQQFGLVQHQLITLLPLITGAVVAWGAAGGLGARRGAAPGVAYSAPILIIWGILILAGAAGGFVLGGIVHQARPLGLSPERWWQIVLAGILIGGAAGYALARLLGFGPTGTLGNLAQLRAGTPRDMQPAAGGKSYWPLLVGLAAVAAVVIAGLALLPGPAERIKAKTLPALPPGAAGVQGVAMWGTQPVPRANIVASEIVTGTVIPAVAETTADTEGRFSLTFSRPGTYELNASWPNPTDAGCTLRTVAEVTDKAYLNLGVLPLAKRVHLDIAPGQVLTSTLPELSWESQPGVYSYALIVTDPSTDRPVFTESTAATHVTVDAALAPGVQYRWSLTGFARPGMPLMCDDGWFSIQP